MRQFFLTFVKHPIKALTSNLSVFIYSAFFIVIDRYTNLYKSVPRLNSFDHWLYIDIPASLLSNYLTKSIIIAFILLYFLKSYIIAFYAHDLQAIFTKTRTNVFNSFTQLRLNYVLRFILLETIIYIIFGVIAFSIYAILGEVWMRFSISTFVILLLLFIAFYPFFYMAISIAGLLSVLPLKFMTTIQKLKTFKSRNKLLSLYAFYGVRGVLELIIFAIAPYFIFKLDLNSLFSAVLIGLTISIPTVIFKASSYSFKLHLLKDDSDMKTIFKNHYNLTSDKVL